ncbi:MAG TPA: transcriptional regulator [Candidatus Bathyarchaeota archaeon]|nr:transcriptional regulator [Candidatus Bathyarchaeota archaeon]
MSKAGKESLYQKALKIIMEAGEEGILQSELWKLLGATSREGSRIALKLERRGLITRRRELHDGRWTYRLFPKIRKISVASIVGCPCLTCPDAFRCAPGGVVDPVYCYDLSRWVLETAPIEGDEGKE